MLASIYDADNPDGPDHDWFRALVVSRAATRITDLGCGTGILTVTLAGPDRRVRGIDPSATMLALAAARSGGAQVEWLEGTSELIEPAGNDLILMSGNVAMHLVGETWHEALGHIAEGLVPGGTLAFETRNPAARSWERWTDPGSERVTSAGRLAESSSVTGPDAAGVVTLSCRNHFLDHDHRVDTTERLQFRSAEQVVDDLAAAGLFVQHLGADWRGRPFTGTPQEPLIIVEAVKPTG